MNYSNGFMHLEQALIQSGVSRDSDTFLDFLGWQRQLNDIITSEKRYVYLSNEQLLLREKVLRELERFALRFTGNSFTSLCTSRTPREQTQEFRKNTFRMTYENSIVAFIKDNEPIGTGFIVNTEKATFVITCAHVVRDFPITINEEIELIHFLPSVGKVNAKMLWYKFRSDVDPINWIAKEDVAIFKVKGISIDNSFIQDSLIPINWASNNYKNCWCFGFIESRRSRGSWIVGIDCIETVGNGFVKLQQTSDIKFEKGISGSPLCNDSGEILGMIQSIYGKQEAYLIPSETIIDILNTANQGEMK